MKKLFVLLAACVVLFACGSGNQGVDYIREAKQAVEKGDYAQAQECMSAYADWAENATEEEFAEAVAELQAQFGDLSEEFYEGLVQGMTEGFGDYMESLEGVSEELEDAMEEVGKAAEDAVEEATKALEGLFN